MNARFVSAASAAALTRLALSLTLVFSCASSLASDLGTLRALETYAVEEAELVYKRVDGIELRARTYRPKTSGVLPAIMDIHGGTWSSGDRHSGAHYNRALASTGLFVIAIDFRQAPGAQHPAASRDIASAIRFVRAHAKEWSIDADSLGLVGSSSGGHLAMLAGFTPNSAEFRDKEERTDASVRYVIALWPVSDPAYRYEYAKRVQRDGLIRNHEAYFGNVGVMQRASVPRLLRAKEQTHAPALLVVQPGSDANIPIEMTRDLIQSYQMVGGRLEYLFYPNQPHAFGHRPSSDTEHLILAMRDFVARIIVRASHSD